MKTDKPPLHIVGLQVQNFMGVKSVRLDPDEHDALVILGGDNGAGKTSTLEAIWSCLGGKPSMLRPIREGEERAEITLDLGDIQATRRFWYDKNGALQSDLKVENGDGAVYKSPQSLLDGLLTKFGFDPFEITTLKPKEQVERLKQALAIDTAAIEEQHKAAYDERTLVHRDLKTLEARFVGLTMDPDAPDEEISLAALTQELSEVHDHNRSCDEAEREAQRQSERLHQADTMIDAQAMAVGRLKAQLATEEARLADMESKRPEIEKQAISAKAIAQGMERRSVDEIEERMELVEATNQIVRRNKSLLAARAEYDAAETKRLQLEKRLAALDTAKREAITQAMKAAKIAIDGLSFDDDGIWIKGIPFAQVNTAMQLSVAVALAVHENPRLRVFRIRDGEKLTPKTMEIVRGIAEEHECQLWVEMAVTADDVKKGYREVSFLIEDGTVRPHLIEVAS